MPPVHKLSWQPDKIFQVQTHLFTLTPFAVKTLSPDLQVREKELISPGHKYIQKSLLLWEKASCAFAWTKESWISSVTGNLLCPTGQNTMMGIPAMMGKWLLILAFQGIIPKSFICCKAVSGWRWKMWCWWGN